MKNSIYILLLNLALVNSSTAQKDTMDNHIRFRAEAGLGIMTYLGTLNNQKVIFSANNTLSYKGGLRIDYKRAGAFLYYNGGRYSENQNVVSGNANFLSTYNGGGLDIRCYPVKQKYYDVFVSFGINYMVANFFTDKFDANGKPYYYWNDGTIRNQLQTYQNTFSSTQTKRDYVYETALGKKSFLFIPIGAGVELRLAERCKVGIVSQYYISFSNNINAVKTSSKKEVLLYNSVSLSYVFGKIKENVKEDPRYKDVNFTMLMETDTDGDGISDIDDHCMGTPKGIKVDKHGCPLDADNDGIIDANDKEVHSRHNTYNDLNGYELTPPEIKDINEEEMEDEALFSKMTEEEIENELDKRKKVYYENLDKNYLKHHPPITVDVDKKTPNK